METPRLPGAGLEPTYDSNDPLDFKALVYEIRDSRDVECKNYGSVGYKAGKWPVSLGTGQGWPAIQASAAAL